MSEMALLVLVFVCGIAVGVSGMAAAIHFATRSHFDGYEEYAKRRAIP